MLKRAYRFNQHRKQNRIINKGLVETQCLCYGEEEDWEHVILCSSMNDIKEQYINKLKAKLYEVVKGDAKKEEIDMIISDITTYVKGE